MELICSFRVPVNSVHCSLFSANYQRSNERLRVSLLVVNDML